MALTVNNFIGFETGDLTEAQAIVNAVVVSTGQRTGGYALKLGSADSYDVPWVTENVSDAGAKYIYGFAFKTVDTTNQTIAYVEDDASSSLGGVSLSSGSLILRNAANTTIDTSSGSSYNDGEWHYVEVYAELNTVGAWEWFIDGVSEGSGTSDFTDGNGFASTTSTILRLYGGSDSNPHYLDDVYILSGATASSDRLGGSSLASCPEVFGFQHDVSSQTADGGGLGVSGTSIATNGWWVTTDGNTSIGAELTASPAYNTIDFNGPSSIRSVYRFDASDGGPTDADGVWTNESNATDGDPSTVATCSTQGSASSNFLQIDGTNAPASGGTISNVYVRFRGQDSGGSPNGIYAVIYTDGLGEQLDSQLIGYDDELIWETWELLATPTGGWTWAKVQALEVKLFLAGATGTGSIAGVEVGVEHDDIIDGDSSIKATKLLANVDRDGGGATTHYLFLGDSGDGNSPAAFDDDTHWGPIDTTPLWYEILTETVPTAAQDVRAGFGTGGAQDIWCYEIWATLLHVPTVASSTTYYETIAASATGTATLTTDLTYGRSLAATAVGTAAFSLASTFYRSLSATATGAAVLNMVSTWYRTLAAGATGTATLAAGRLYARTLAATATGTAAISQVLTYARTLAATATGTPTLNKVHTFARSLAATATGTASMTRALTFARTLAATATGSAALATVSTWYRTLAATATGTADLTKGFLYQRALNAVATGTAALSKVHTFARTLAATATGVAALSDAATKYVTITATAIGTPALTKVSTWYRTLTATATGTAALAKGFLYAKALDAIATGTATLSKANVYAKALTATATGTAAINKVSTWYKTLATTATGTPALNKVSTWYRTLAATASGSAALGRSTTFVRTLAATATGLATLVENKITGAVTYYRTLDATAVGVGIISPTTTWYRTLAASATGIANLDQGILYEKAIAATAIGTAAISTTMTAVRTLAATATGTAAQSISTTYLKTISATATGAAAIGKTIKKTLSAVASGSAAFVKKVSKTLTASATGTPTLAEKEVIPQQLDANATGTPSLTEIFIAAPPLVLRGIRAIWAGFRRFTIG